MDIYSKVRPERKLKEHKIKNILCIGEKRTGNGRPKPNGGEYKTSHSGLISS